MRRVIAPELGVHGVYLQDILLGKPGHKGGIRSFESVKKDIIRLLKQEADTTVTTLFDRYGLPSDWPGLNLISPNADIVESRKVICTAMQGKINDEMGDSFRPERFVPYIQFHELEALLFVKPHTTAELLGDIRHGDALDKVVKQHGGCEQINQGLTTAPSKRIAQLFPNYRKGSGINAHLPRVCSKVGLSELRAACPLFDQWIRSLLPA